MYLTKRQTSNLKKIIATAQKLLDQAAKAPAPVKVSKTGKSKRHRRTAVEAKKMRAEIMAQRKKGVPVTKLAERYNVSTAYIYMIK
ncbi:hypothetical protein [Aestuariivirga sp.]|uniref:hypothetical protein n=1 Tax=Aestuariivirga sp. TaxID=2650926 RepID=UPI0039E345D7